MAYRKRSRTRKGYKKTRQSKGRSGRSVQVVRLEIVQPPTPSLGAAALGLAQAPSPKVAKF